MKKSLLAFSIVFLFSIQAGAQTFFQQSCVGSFSDEFLGCVTLAPNGTLIVAGNYNFSTNEHIPMYCLDTATGNVRWATIVGITPRVSAGGMDGVSDGVIVGGSKIVNSTNISGLVFKTDTSGNVVWARELPGTQKYVNDVKRTPGDGAVVCGSQNLGSEAWIGKLDAGGNVLWQKSYRFTQSYNDFKTITVTHDNNYVALGYTNCPSCPGAMPFNASIVKTDSNGVVQWAKSFNQAAGCYFQSVTETYDHGFAIVGSLGQDTALQNDSSFACALLMKLDSAGNLQWCNYYPLGSVFGTNTIYEAGNHTLIISGNLNILPAYFAGCLMITSSTGVPLMINAIDYANRSSFSDMKPGPNGRVYLAGGNSLTNTEMFVVKTQDYMAPGCSDSSFAIIGYPLPLTVQVGVTTASFTSDNTIVLTVTPYPVTQNICLSNSINEIPPQKNSFQVMPQPANNYSTIILQSPLKEKCVVHLFNVEGKEEKQLSLVPTTKEFRIERESLPAGLYLIQITNAEGEIIGNGKILFVD